MIAMQRTGALLLTIAAVLNAGTIFLNDSACATAAIVDTNGGFVTVRHDGRSVRIDKKQVRKIDIGADSLTSGPGKSRITGAFLPVNDALAGIIAAYPVKKTVIALNSGIVFQKQPLTVTSGVDKKDIGAFSDRMARFLAKRATARAISKEGAYFYLSGGVILGEKFRYLAMPAEISVRSNERKMSVSSFARLDKAGNFVPAETGTTLHARETETTVRFVIIDLAGKTVVFDERVKENDPGLQSLEDGNSNDPQTAPGNNSILSVERKIETLLKRHFK